MHDPKCYELAEYFLDDETLRGAHIVVDQRHMKSLLAQHIQDAIEDWLRGLADDTDGV